MVEDRPCRGLEDFVLRHRETVLRNKKERKKERKKENLRSALKALIKGQEKKIFIDTNAVSTTEFFVFQQSFYLLLTVKPARMSVKMQSPSSSQLFRCGLTAFFG